MKVAPIHRAAGKYIDKLEHSIVHTGQHYDVNMSDAFFRDLEMPQPAKFLGAGSGSHAEQTAKIMIEFEEVCNELHPDLVIVVGDVNSTMAASITAVKLGIPVAHIEGGLRSFDRGMPEEINRMVTDTICDYCFITEKSAETNLLKENFPAEKIFFTGNTMIDSQRYAMPKAEKSDVLDRLGLEKRNYVPVTMHRPSNVDEPGRLEAILNIFEWLSRERKIVFPAHPRTLKNIKKYKFDNLVDSIEGLKIIEPVGYIDFLALMMNSDFVLTDSGGIQEETTALGIPCITARTSTERPVTCDIGTNVLVMPEPDVISAAIKDILNGKRKHGQVPELWDGRSAERIMDIIANKIFSF